MPRTFVAWPSFEGTVVDVLLFLAMEPRELELPVLLGHGDVALAFIEEMDIAELIGPSNHHSGVQMCDDAQFHGVAGLVHFAAAGLVIDISECAHGEDV